MGLDEVVNGGLEYNGIKGRVKKLQPNGDCPECGSSNTQKKSYYWRCRDEDCDVLTFLDNPR